MYYRLKDEYILRGWDKLPYAIVNVRTKEPFFLTAKRMQAVKLCDGNIDISESLISDELKNIIAEIKDKGFIEECEKGNGLKENQKYKEYPSRYIGAVQWSVTGKCNFKCRHCYMSAPDVNAKELSHEDAMKIIDQLAEFGVMTVLLTGREPLFRNDFLEITDALIERDIRIAQIYSNGALVTKKFLTELDTRNIHRDTVNYLASPGVTSIKISMADNIGEWAAHNDNKQILIKDFLQTLLDYIPQYYEDGMPVDISLGWIFNAYKNEPDKYEIPSYHEEIKPDKLICGTARRDSYISPEGRVLICGLCAGLKMQDM